MRSFTPFALAAAISIAAYASALAQPVDDPHHPAEAQSPAADSAQPPAPQAPNATRPGPAAGMMGSGMPGPGTMGAGPGPMNMMETMGRGGRGPAGNSGTAPMMPMMDMMTAAPGAGDHVEGRLAFLKTELKITEAQTAQWKAFEEAVRANGRVMGSMRQSMMSGSASATTLPERLALEEKAVASYAAALGKTRAALDQLYAVLSADQKKAADGIALGPMGMPIGMR